MEYIQIMQQLCFILEKFIIIKILKNILKRKRECNSYKKVYKYARNYMETLQIL